MYALFQCTPHSAPTGKAIIIDDEEVMVRDQMTMDRKMDINKAKCFRHCDSGKVGGWYHFESFSHVWKLIFTRGLIERSHSKLRKFKDHVTNCTCIWTIFFHQFDSKSVFSPNRKPKTLRNFKKGKNMSWSRRRCVCFPTQRRIDLGFYMEIPCNFMDNTKESEVDAPQWWYPIAQAWWWMSSASSLVLLLIFTLPNCMAQLTLQTIIPCAYI